MSQQIERFGNIKDVLELPRLVELQIGSFDTFLQKGVSAANREDSGLQGAFREIFPIDESDKGRTGGLVLDFLEYEIGVPPYDTEECREKDLTYQAPMFAKLQLIHRDTGLIKEDKVFLGDLPLMTEEGSFVVNGADRVIVSQIHRSPGVYFTLSYRGTKKMYAASIIPMPKRGPWIELEFTAADVLEMKINKRKFPVTMLLRVLGMDDDGMRKLFKGYEEMLEPTFLDDKTSGTNADEALLRLFTILRPGDPPKRDKAFSYLHSLLADPKRYDLGDAGRYKVNAKLGIENPEKTLLVLEDGVFKDAGLIPTIRCCNFRTKSQALARMTLTTSATVVFGLLANCLPINSVSAWVVWQEACVNVCSWAILMLPHRKNSSITDQLLPRCVNSSDAANFHSSKTRSTRWRSCVTSAVFPRLDLVV
jgi:DNA-directed RNA polymerase subunit beta